MDTTPLLKSSDSKMEEEEFCDKCHDVYAGTLEEHKKSCPGDDSPGEDPEKERLIRAMLNNMPSREEWTMRWPKPKFEDTGRSYINAKGKRMHVFKVTLNPRNGYMNFK